MLTQKESEELIKEKLKILRERCGPAHQKAACNLNIERPYYPKYEAFKRVIKEESRLIATEHVETILEYLTNDDIDVNRFEHLLKALVG